MTNNARGQTNQELALIPRGDRAQNLFRTAFNRLRMNSLGPDPRGRSDLRSVVEQAKEAVRAELPTFEPQYDPRLFNP